MPYSLTGESATPAEIRAYHAERARRSRQVDDLLIAKGLKPGCGKWSEVHRRHMAKVSRA